jgi:hypothetical protein
MAVCLKRCLKGLAQVIGQQAGFRLIGSILYNHDELVCNMPREVTVPGQGICQAPGDLSQNAVARIGPERIIDRPESVETEHEEAKSIRAAEDTVEIGAELVAVRQTGQSVMVTGRTG